MDLHDGACNTALCAAYMQHSHHLYRTPHTLPLCPHLYPLQLRCCAFSHAAHTLHTAHCTPAHTCCLLPAPHTPEPLCPFHHPLYHTCCTHLPHCGENARAWHRLLASGGARSNAKTQSTRAGGTLRATSKNIALRHNAPLRAIMANALAPLLRRSINAAYARRMPRQCPRLHLRRQQQQTSACAGASTRIISSATENLQRHNAQRRRRCA